MFFKNIKNLEELKKEYRRLALENHPDRGGKTEVMQSINSEYDILFKKLKNEFNNDENNKYKKTETSSLYKDFINKIIGIDGIEVEICGTWIWISGDTKKHKEILKMAGCKWAKTKKMWYWRSEEYRSFSRNKFTMDQIRSKYGSQSVAGNPRPLID